jgi:hypothetical protein
MLSAVMTKDSAADSLSTAVMQSVITVSIAGSNAAGNLADTSAKT